MKKKNLSIGWRIPILIIVTLFLLIFNQLLLNVPFNFHSGAFLTELLVFLLAVFACIKGRPEEDFDLTLIKNLYAPIIIIILFILASVIGSPYTGGLHNYKNQADIEEVSFSTPPLTGRRSSWSIRIRPDSWVTGSSVLWVPRKFPNMIWEMNGHSLP